MNNEIVLNNHELKEDHPIIEFIFAIINKKLNNIDKLIQNIMKFTNMKFSSYNNNYLLGLAPNLLNKDGTFKYKTEKEYLDFALNFNYDEYQNKIKNIYLKKKYYLK